jgi:hypothetical protein
MSLKGSGRWLLALATAAAASVVTVVAAASPASAATVSVTSGLGSPASATIIATCPAGTNLVGAGGQINAGGGNVVLTAVIPDVAGNLVIAIGEENGAFGGMWSVTATAICDPLAVAVPVIVASANNSMALKSVGAACPAAAQLTGLGFAVFGGIGRVFPQQAQPAAALGGAMFTAVENGIFAGAWQLVGYALCANPAGFAPSLQLATSALNNASPKSVSSPACPAGSTIFGVGTTINGFAGRVTADVMMPDAAQIISTANGTEFIAFAANWQITSFGICW